MQWIVKAAWNDFSVGISLNACNFILLTEFCDVLIERTSSVIVSYPWFGYEFQPWEIHVIVSVVRAFFHGPYPIVWIAVHCLEWILMPSVLDLIRVQWCILGRRHSKANLLLITMADLVGTRVVFSVWNQCLNLVYSTLTYNQSKCKTKCISCKHKCYPLLT